jgi:beta-mannosidase
MDLAGAWSVTEADEDLRRRFPRPDLDESGWLQVQVPGHWRTEAALAASDGPVLYRRHFEMGALADGQRAWLVFEGIFYQSDVWLDGSYLGDTEGYFFPHSFDVSAALRGGGEHVLAVDVGCERQGGRTTTKSLLGAFASSPAIDPGWNPGGIWAPVRVLTSGPVRMTTLRALCSEATTSRAVVEFGAVIDSSAPLTAALRTRLTGPGGPASGTVVEKTQPLAVGTNRVRWRAEVPEPQLWWPVGMGDQPLYEVEVEICLDGELSDRRRLHTGLRQVRAHNLVWSVNGERVFLKGANLLPTRTDLARATAAEVERDVELARDAGLNLLRAHSHVARAELYDAADRLGVLIWQDLPLRGSFKGARSQAVRQAAAAVDALGHHPSIVVWCGHDEPFPIRAPGASRSGSIAAAKWVSHQALPSWNKTVLDRSVRRALLRSDPTRPTVAHSGRLPHPGGGTDSHLYLGWRAGRAGDLGRVAATWPAAARFVSELGAQAVPDSTAFMVPASWPELDWAGLAERYGLQKSVFDRRVPAHQFADFEQWQLASQQYQAEIVQAQVETLRRLQFRPVGGFAVFCLNDAQPAVSASLLDYKRRPKPAYGALKAACAPVLVVADWPAPSYAPSSTLCLDLHVVNDLREVLVGAVVEATVSWPGGGRRWIFEGDAAGRACSFVGSLRTVLPELPAPRYDPLPLGVDLRLQWPGGAGPATNNYRSVIAT